eukprot:6181128-Pleurochrysis_carterae.AAC.3
MRRCHCGYLELSISVHPRLLDYALLFKATNIEACVRDPQADVVAEQQAITAAFNEFGITFFQQDAATLAPFFADDSRAVIFDKVNQETFVYGPGEFEQFAAKDFELMPTLEGFSLVALDVYVNLDVPVRQAFNVALNPTTFEERGLRIGTFFYNADHLIVSSLIAI